MVKVPPAELGLSNTVIDNEVEAGADGIVRVYGRKT